MKRAWKKRMLHPTWTILVLAMAFGSPVHAAVRASDRSIPFPRDLDLDANQDLAERHANDISQIRPISSLRDFTPQDMADLVPPSMQATDNQSQVAAQILDHSLNTFFKRNSQKRSDFGSAARKMERLLEQDIALGSSDQNSIQHVLKLSMKAAQSQAELGYRGLVDARFSYQLTQQRANLELAQKLADQTNIVLSHSVTRQDRVDMVSVNWKF